MKHGSGKKLKRSASQRFRAYRQRKDCEYYQFRMRHDVARLIEGGLERNPGMTQSDLAKKADKYESQISQLIHSESNAKLAMIAQVLVPLGVVPKIVDTAEWDRLQAIAENPPTHTDTRAVAASVPIIVNAPPKMAGEFYGYTVTIPSIGTASGAVEAGHSQTASTPGRTDVVDRSRDILATA